MDGLQAAITSLAVIVIVLIMVMFVCHLFGPKASAWICSNREEKIGLSKSKIFNANGYLINSGSDIFLSSTGSFKRFDSIDHDYKEVGQTSITSPTWKIPAPDIPPQPLRPAPAPVPSTKERRKSLEKQPIKQQSCDAYVPFSTVIPRPIAKRQLSGPAGIAMPINLADAAAKISKRTRSCTNPFLNGSTSIPEDDNQPTAAVTTNNHITSSVVELNQENQLNDSVFYTNENEIIVKNPFFKSIVEPSENFFQFNGNFDSVDRHHQETEQITTTNFDNFDAKFLDSPCSDGFENNFDTSFTTNQFRNRSLSETEVILETSVSSSATPSRRTSQCNESLADSNSTNPFNKTNLHKTLSETYLEQYSMNRNNRNSSQTWMFGGRSLARQGSNMSLTKSMIGSQNSIISENGVAEVDIKRAMSCDSVSSESSVVLGDLELPTPAVTGLLCVGLQYDKNTATSEGVELVVTVMEAKELIGPLNSSDSLDTFVRIYLVPDETGALQTKLFKNSLCPSYNETFSFWLSKKRSRRSLWFHLYHSGNVHTLLGEAEMQICDVTRPITTWLSLSDSRHNNSTWGELMFSLSYLPTAERLTVVVVKARNLKLNTVEGQPNSIQNVFIKVYLLKNDKKVSKKKTSVKRTDCSPIYNESMIFSVPPYMLSSIQIRLTVINATDLQSSDNTVRMMPVGHVIVGSNTSGKGLRHWNQMLTSLRKPVAMWHAVRQQSAKSKTIET